MKSRESGAVSSTPPAGCLLGGCRFYPPPPAFLAVNPATQSPDICTECLQMWNTGHHIFPITTPRRGGKHFAKQTCFWQVPAALGWLTGSDWNAFFLLYYNSHRHSEMLAILLTNVGTWALCPSPPCCFCPARSIFLHIKLPIDFFFTPVHFCSRDHGYLFEPQTRTADWIQ